MIRLVSSLTATSARVAAVSPARTKLMATLFVAQVCGSTGQSIVLAVGSILAASITGTNTWSGLPVAVGALGTALASWPLSRLMARSGRRPGLALGYGLAVVGSLVGMAGAAVRSFPLLLAGMALFGIASTSNLLARYAAADVSPGAQRGRAMGLIVWGSTVGSLIGPNLMGPALRLSAVIGVESTASAFLVSVAGYALGALLIQNFLRPDPLAIARETHELAAPGAASVAARGLGAILADVRVQIALATLTVSQFVMISTTSTSPLYLHDQGHNVQIIGVAVSLHLAGMYVTSPLAGWLCERRGHVHAGQMQRHGDADGLDIVALIVEIERRRRRGADHDELADREGGERDLHAYVGEDGAQAASRCARCARHRHLLRLPRDGQRIRAQEDLDQERAQHVAGDGHEERARRRLEADESAQTQSGAHEIRAD